MEDEKKPKRKPFECGMFEPNEYGYHSFQPKNVSKYVDAGMDSIGIYTEPRMKRSFVGDMAYWLFRKSLQHKCANIKWLNEDINTEKVLRLLSHSLRLRDTIEKIPKKCTVLEAAIKDVCADDPFSLEWLSYWFDRYYKAPADFSENDDRAGKLLGRFSK